MTLYRTNLSLVFHKKTSFFNIYYQFFIANNCHTSLKNRSTLPNLSHTQSNFKSLLLAPPVNNTNTTNATNTSNSANQSSNRVYFRPQDLGSNNNRLVQLQPSTPLANITENAKTENELYLLQKNSLDKHSNGNNGLSNKIVIKKITSPTQSNISKPDTDFPKNCVNHTNNGANKSKSVSALENGIAR